MTTELGNHLEDSVLELADSYALGALDGDDLARFEACLLDGDAHCRAELAEAERVVEMLARSAVPILPSRSLRDRLMRTVAGESAERRNGHGARPARPEARLSDESPFWVARSTDIPWEPFIARGSKARLLHMDTVAREAVYLVHAEPGVSYPAHRHGGREEIFMLEGDLMIDGEVYGPGDYIRAMPGTIHGFNTTETGGTFLLRVSLENEVL